ncbi:TonB-dependent receptor plug domain-containing protein, partial [Dialister invisus]|uniref:TonB-dependent receptor plug domain-containing protein n=1 Tax=Dialister invisus TaxID=218538 RepID=UPI003AB12356
MKKKILSAALLSVLVSSALGIVTAGAVYEIDEVTVTADREGNVVVFPGGLVNQTAKLGILGNKSVMDIPYSEMSMTEKTLETFSDPSQPLANVLQNNPSIRSSTSSPMYTDFSMRGINMNGNHMMLNGIPSLFYQFNGPPNHIIERMDITSG